MRKYDCRSRTPCRRARRLSPLIAACSSLASVGKVMFFGCTVVSTVTRLRSLLRSAPFYIPKPGKTEKRPPAYNLPVYASQRPIDATQDSVRTKEATLKSLACGQAEEQRQGVFSH